MNKKPISKYGIEASQRLAKEVKKANSSPSARREIKRIKQDLKNMPDPVIVDFTL